MRLTPHILLNPLSSLELTGDDELDAGSRKERETLREGSFRSTRAQAVDNLQDFQMWYPKGFAVLQCSTIRRISDLSSFGLLLGDRIFTGIEPRSDCRKELISSISR